MLFRRFHYTQLTFSQLLRKSFHPTLLSPLLRSTACGRAALGPSMDLLVKRNLESDPGNPAICSPLLRSPASMDLLVKRNLESDPGNPAMWTDHALSIWHEHFHWPTWISPLLRSPACDTALGPYLISGKLGNCQTAKPQDLLYLSQQKPGCVPTWLSPRLRSQDPASDCQKTLTMTNQKTLQQPCCLTTRDRISGGIVYNVILLPQIPPNRKCTMVQEKILTNITTIFTNTTGILITRIILNINDKIKLKNAFQKSNILISCL